MSWNGDSLPCPRPRWRPRRIRDVQSFAQQVDADQNIEDAEAEITDDLDPLQGVDVGMDVADLEAGFRHVFGEIFRHAFRERVIRTR